MLWQPPVPRFEDLARGNADGNAIKMLNKTVQIVERDPIEAKHILDFFKKYNFRNKIEIVHGKTEALDYVFETGEYKDRKDHEVPGLILLDLLTNKTKDLKILKPLQS